MPQLEKELEEAQLKWANMAKKHLALAIEVKKVLKLEANVTTLKKTIFKLHGSHQVEIETLLYMHQVEVERLCDLHSAEIEHKDYFWETGKVQVLSKLQASYNAKLPRIYQDQYELGYWAGYVEAERVACGYLELSSEDAPKPTRSMESVESSSEG